MITEQTLVPNVLKGKITIPSSKSVVHRMMICAALGNKQVRIDCKGAGNDITATANCLKALGAEIEITESHITVQPLIRSNIGNTLHKLNCGESGSTLRFMLPVAASLGAYCEFSGEGRLPERPLSPLHEEMSAHGIELSANGTLPLLCKGLLPGGTYTIDGGVSSQFISGLLMALPVTGQECRIIVNGRRESTPYIDLTISVLKLFGIEIETTDYGYFIPEDQKFATPSELFAEGDWSSASFWLVAGCIGKEPIECNGIDYHHSVQGDKKVVDVLRSMGAEIETGNGYTVAYPSKLKGIETDCSNIPDAVPILSVAAAMADSPSTFTGIGRLRLKESDRVETTMRMLQAFGIKSSATENSLTIYPGMPVGGSVCSAADHRIAASAAIMATVAHGNTKIDNMKCIDKSYPDFCKDYINLGGKFH